MSFQVSIIFKNYFEFYKYQYSIVFYEIIPKNCLINLLYILENCNTINNFARYEKSFLIFSWIYDTVEHGFLYQKKCSDRKLLKNLAGTEDMKKFITD